jgi:predicted anti-sigma-YlaC factor YlaD
MAVRLFDLTEPQSTRLEVLEAPPRRQHLRRTKQRYALIGVVALAVPFFAALVVLGVGH